MLSHKEQIGRLDRRIIFKKKVISTNVSNEQEVVAWVYISSNPRAWASVDETSGSEPFEVEQQQAHTTATFTIRYRNDITQENRIEYNGGNWDIQSILEISRRRFLKIVAVKGGQYMDTGFVDGEFSADFSTDYAV